MKQEKFHSPSQPLHRGYGIPLRAAECGVTTLEPPEPNELTEESPFCCIQDLLRNLFLRLSQPLAKEPYLHARRYCCLGSHTFLYRALWLYLTAYPSPPQYQRT